MADKLVKYMGSSHVRVLEKGEDFDGRLADPLTDDLVWDQKNKWVVNVGELPTEAQDLLLEQPDFKDVSDLKRVPSNLHQQMFLGHKASESVEDAVVVETAKDESTDEANPEGGAESGTPAVTNTGGSTRGRRGGS